MDNFLCWFDLGFNADNGRFGGIGDVGDENGRFLVSQVACEDDFVVGVGLLGWGVVVGEGDAVGGRVS